MPKTSPHSEAPIDSIAAALPLPSSSTFQLTWPAGEEPLVHSIPSAPQGSIELAQHPSTSPNIINPFFDQVPLEYVAEPMAGSSKVTTPVDEGGPTSALVLGDGSLHDDPNHPNQQSKRPAHPPRFARASSTPLPAQLKHLRHPSRRNVVESPSPTPVVVATKKSLPPPPAHAQIAELALELADSVQTVIQTLIQVSPPHLLDPAKEQLSGCTLQIPTTSVSALLTTMKNLNYMSANLSSLSTPEKTPPLETVTEEDLHVVSEIKSLDMAPLTGDGEEILVSNPKTLAFDDFDIGEALQSVGDVLSGISASAGVDLVLYHADVGMKHVNVRGDECGILYSISYVIRQIIAVAQPRDEIEIGLYVSSPTGARLNREYSSSGANGVPPSPPPPAEYEEPLVCTLEITHRFASPNPAPSDAAQPPLASTSIQERRQPDLNTAILQNTLRHVRATLQADVTPSSGAPIPNSRTYELSVLLSPGPAGSPTGYPLSEEEMRARQPFHDLKVASEPTLDELASFVAADGGLKGKKAIFHASERSSFAHHLTSYLTAWGMDVSHVPIESGACPALVGEGESSTAASSVAGDGVETPAEADSPSSRASRSRAGSDADVKTGTPKVGTPKSETPKTGTPKSESPESSSTPASVKGAAPSIGLSTAEGLLRQPELVELAGTSFIIIDDDVNVLRRRLAQIRKTAEAKFRPQTLPQTIGNLRKRPGLQHRPRSSPSIRMATNQTQPSIPGTIEESQSENEETVTKILEFDPLQVVILHFTSLSNYKVVQDTIYASVYAAPSDQGFTTYAGGFTSYPMGDLIPEVMVIPKPAGPRRFLTALHTAVQKPFIDPFFAPIATTPMSPNAQYRVSPWGLPFAGGSALPTPHGTSPASASGAGAAGVLAGSRILAGRQHSSGSTGSATGSGASNSSRLPTLANALSSESRKSPKGHPAEQQMQQQQQQAQANIVGGVAAQTHIPSMTIPIVPMTYTGQTHMYTPHPPSPLSRDAVEYFSVNAAATQIGDSTGVLVHSPDGRPAGIFFQPQQQSREGRRTNSSNSSVDQQGGHGPGGRPQARPQPGSFMGLDAALASVSPVVTPGAAYPPTGRFRGSPLDTSALPTPTTPGRGPLSARRSTAGEDPGRPPLARSPSSRAAVPLAQINGVPRRKTSNTGSDGGTGGGKGALDRPRPLQVDSTGSAGSVTGQNIRPPLVDSPRTSPGGSASGMMKKVGRRSTGERASPAVKKVKAGGDGSIVPPINVLIVEDNPINQTILSTFMKRKKINYGTAKNGQEAVDKWRAGNYHLILMDIQMPVKDGIEATKDIRTLEKERNSSISPSTPPSELQEAAKATNVPHSPYRSSVIIVALTASSQKSDRVAALAAGCNDFLTKPVSMNWLNTKIIEWGSIKALEMFQDPATARLFNAQNAKAKVIASQLKLPPSRNPSPAPADIPDSAVVHPTLTVQAPSTPDLPIVGKSEVAQPLPASQPEPKDAASPSPPFSPRSISSELSGDDALKKHVQAITEEEARRRDAAAHARPVILGEGALSSENSSNSIESVLRGIPPIAEDAFTPDTPPLADAQKPAVPMAPPSAPPTEPSVPATEPPAVKDRPAYP
ncbi:ssk1 response regulator receiver [Tulasnella sp. 427]|nr:ssk1 response regulator receiver [Tulasnella sp. 427]